MVAAAHWSSKSTAAKLRDAHWQHRARFQQREDFEIYAPQSQRSGPPTVVSAKFTHPTNPKTSELYKKVVDAEASKDKLKAIELLKQIVALDAADFIAWAKLGSLYFEQKNLTDAEAAFRKSLENKIEYTPAWIFMGRFA